MKLKGCLFGFFCNIKAAVGNSYKTTICHTFCQKLSPQLTDNLQTPPTVRIHSVRVITTNQSQEECLTLCVCECE